MFWNAQVNKYVNKFRCVSCRRLEVHEFPEEIVGHIPDAMTADEATMICRAAIIASNKAVRFYTGLLPLGYKHHMLRRRQIQLMHPPMPVGQGQSVQQCLKLSEKCANRGCRICMGRLRGTLSTACVIK